MLIDKVKIYAESLAAQGKTANEIETLVKSFVGEEKITNVEGKEVNFKVVEKVEEEIENVDVELQIKKAVKEEVKKAVGETKKTKVIVPDEQMSIPAQAKRFSSGSFTAFKGPDADIKAYKTGMWLHAMNGNQAAKRYCNEYGYKAMSEGTNTAGGYLVPDVLSATVIENVNTYGVFRPLCRTFIMDSDVQLVPKVTKDLGYTWETEEESRADSQKTLDRVTLTAKKIGSLAIYSNELSEDSIVSITDLLISNMSRQIAYGEDYTGFMGNGVADDVNGGITGLITAMEAVAGNAGVISATSGTWDSIVMNDFTDLMSILPDYAYKGGNVKWVMSRSFKSRVVDRLCGAYTGNTLPILAAGFFPAFHGYPVVTTDILPRFETDNASIDHIVCLFGDISMSTAFGDRRSITLSFNDKLYWRTDQVAIKMDERIAINAHDPGTATVAGPVVGLQA